MFSFIEENEQYAIDAIAKEIAKPSSSDEIFKELNIQTEQDIKNFIKEVNNKREELIDKNEQFLIQNHQQQSFLNHFS